MPNFRKILEQAQELTKPFTSDTSTTAQFFRPDTFAANPLIKKLIDIKDKSQQATIAKPIKEFNPQPLYLEETKKTYQAKSIPKEYLNTIKSASQRTDLEPALLASILMKESEMGTNPKAKNIAEIREDAVIDLKNKKINVDLSTPSGVINAMADYLKL
ncbi:MAG: hypothetical protein AABY22_30410, partial [Nanoarchaeota archaeon]